MSCWIGFKNTLPAGPVKVSTVTCSETGFLCTLLELCLDLSDGIMALLLLAFSSTDLTIAAGQLRQAVADTFVSLGESWEMGKKFSGDDSGT